MRLPLLTLLIATALLGTATPAASAAPAADSAGPTASAAARCGQSQRLGAYSITTRKVSCRIAKRVIAQWNKKCGKKPIRRCRLASGYLCRYSFDGYESATVRCTKGTRRVTWKR